jgi:hypothetical protein
LNSSQLIAKATSVVESMTDNPAFPDPTPKLSDVSAAITALSVAQVAALDGGRNATALRNSRAADLRLLMNQLGGYVSSVAEGDELAIRSSGLGVRRNGAPAPEPESPKDLRARISEHKGRVDLRWQAVLAAVTYHIEHSSTDPEVEANWKLVEVSTRSRIAVKGLPSGQVSYFRVAGIGTAGMGPWSQVSSTLVK